MEKKGIHHQQIRGWEDEEEAQAFTALYSRITHPKKQHNHLSKIEMLANKLPAKRDPKMSSKNFFKQKRCLKLLTQTKYRQPWQLHNDKKTLLQYLKKQPSNHKLKLQESQIVLNESITFKQQQQKQFSLTTSNFPKPNKEFQIRPSLGNQGEHPTFKDLFFKLSPIKKQRRKRFYLKTKSFGSSKLIEKNQRTRPLVELLPKSEVKRNYQVKKQTNLFKQTKYFPLFYRELEQRMQKNKKNRQAAKNQFKLHKKKYNSQLSMANEDKSTRYQEQFLDINLVTKP